MWFHFIGNMFSSSQSQSTLNLFHTLGCAHVLMLSYDISFFRILKLDKTEIDLFDKAQVCRCYLNANKFNYAQSQPA